MKKKKDRNRNILLLLAYAALFVFTLAMEWVGIRDTAVRVIVNLSTLALVLLGGAFCAVLYRRALPGAKSGSEADANVNAGGGEEGAPSKASDGRDAEPVIDKDAYLAFAREKELTRRGTEIGFLVVNGYSNQRIAEELYISEATVKKHLTHIYEKTGENGRKALKRAVTLK